MCGMRRMAASAAVATVAAAAAVAAAIAARAAAAAAGAVVSPPPPIVSPLPPRAATVVSLPRDVPAERREHARWGPMRNGRARHAERAPGALDDVQAWCGPSARRRVCRRATCM